MPFSLKTALRGFLGGPVVKNLPTNAAGHGFDPWSGTILLLRRNRRNHCDEKPTPGNYRAAPAHRNERKAASNNKDPAQSNQNKDCP